MTQSCDALAILAASESRGARRRLAGTPVGRGCHRDGSLIVFHKCERVCVCLCESALCQHAIGRVFFNLAVFSLDRCSEIQVIDASVWYSPRPRAPHRGDGAG